MKFFNGIGSGSPGTVDADETGGMNTFLYQHYGVNRTAPIFVSNEANGWYIDRAGTNLRAGEQNPWNVSSWGGVLPSDDEHLFPSARFGVWYTSGAPRAVGALADSGLGQSGVDPAGVAPAHFYTMFVPTWVPDGRPSWTSTNLSIQSWLDAFDTFGPRGTRAMFAHPDGYLEQFE